MNALRRVAPRPGLVCKENPYRLGSLASSLDAGAAAREPGLSGGIFKSGAPRGPQPRCSSPAATSTPLQGRSSGCRDVRLTRRRPGAGLRSEPRLPPSAPSWGL